MTELLKEAGINLNMVELIMYGMLVLSGIFIHFVKKCKVEKIHVLDYWRQRPEMSLLSLFAAFAGYLILIKSGSTGVLEYIGAGYMVDSMLNRMGMKNDESA